MHIHFLFNPAFEQGLDKGVQKQRLDSSWSLAIGNFDGVHQGHQVLLRHLIEQAQRVQGAPAVMMFDPQPLEYFKADQAPVRIMSSRDKIEALFEQGVQLVLLCRFDDSVANLSPQAFLESICGSLNVKGFTLGQDFRFGHKRGGDIAFLKAYGDVHGIEVFIMPDFMENEVRVSSSFIRSHLQADRFPDAAKALGRAFRVSGKVKHGRKLARGLGFPTANLQTQFDKPPLQGVFVGLAYLPYNESSERVSRQGLMAVANAGMKPTVDGDRWQLEVHIFDDRLSGGTIADKTFYGQRLSFEPMARLRHEQKFGSIDELKQAIAGDVVQAQAFFDEQAP